VTGYAPIDPRFRSVIVCDDIREEIGNKKSLMGILAGDILTASMPANVQIAFYIDYLPTDDGNDQISFQLLQDETEIAKGRLEVDAKRTRHASLIVPKALIRFEHECTFRMLASINGGETMELLRKQVSLNPQNAGIPPPPSQQAPPDASSIA
jgi:hypothetical protein